MWIQETPETETPPNKNKWSDKLSAKMVATFIAIIWIGWTAQMKIDDVGVKYLRWALHNTPMSEEEPVGISLPGDLWSQNQEVFIQAVSEQVNPDGTLKFVDEEK